MEDILDYECFGNSILNNISLIEIEDIREKIKVFRNVGERENFGWLV